MSRFTILLMGILFVVVLVVPTPCGADDDNPPVAPAAPNPPQNQPAAANNKVAPPPGPGGMVYVPGGISKMGTSGAEVFQLTRGRSPEQVQVFFYETPDHDLPVAGFFLDKYEVTNAQYYAFLQATAATVYDTSAGALGTLDDVAANLIRLKDKDRKNAFLTYWLQLYTANEEAIWEAFGEERVAKLKVMRPDGTEDKLKTAENFRFEPLPRKLKLEFYSRRPPLTWPGIEPPKGRWNFPVRDVTYLDAQRYAEWAGKHIPTEAEWEWAARGPEAWRFPWGNVFPDDKQAAMERGNWAASYVDEHYNPVPVAVDDIPGSTTWCGAMNMIGNVAEWSSSWFYTYPGFARKTTWDTRLGRVKVIRGGHGEMREMLTLRAAGRNFVGSGPKAPPYVSNHFPWVGFRCAWSPKAGSNQLEPIVERASRGGRVDEKMLALDRYQGAVTESFAESGAFDEHHVYVLGPSHAIVFAPVKQVLWENGKETWISEAWAKASRFRKTKDLEKRSTESDYPVMVLGVLHTDVGLDKVWGRKPLPPGAKPPPDRGRGRARAPETVSGKMQAGTYLLTLWHGRLALATPSLEFECFISAAKQGAEVVKVDPEACPEPTFELDPLGDEASYAFHIWLGGKKTDPEVFVKIEGKLVFELGALDSKGAWRQGVPFALPDWEDTELPDLDRIRKDIAAAAAKAANGGGVVPGGDEEDPDDADDDEKDPEDKPKPAPEDPEDPKDPKDPTDPKDPKDPTDPKDPPKPGK